MKYYDWYKQCPYAALFQYGYPAFRMQYNTFMPSIDEIDDEYTEDPVRAQRDIERVLPIIYQNLANEINQAAALGIEPKLTAYLIREMVEFIDRTYDQYDKTYSYNITRVSEALKTNYYWIFNIFRIYGMPFEVQNSILHNVVIISLDSLRIPAGTAGLTTTP